MELTNLVSNELGGTTSTIVLDTAVLMFFRSVPRLPDNLLADSMNYRLFFGFCSYRFLLRSLFHDLKRLASDTGEEDSADIELGSLSLPTPNGARVETRQSPHAAIARFCFSLCFSESCMLFLIFIFQEIEAFHEK